MKRSVDGGGQRCYIHWLLQVTHVHAHVKQNSHMSITHLLLGVIRLLHPPLLLKWQIANCHSRWQFSTCEGPAHICQVKKARISLLLPHWHHFNWPLLYVLVWCTWIRAIVKTVEKLWIYIFTSTHKIWVHKKLHSVEIGCYESKWCSVHAYMEFSRCTLCNNAGTFPMLFSFRELLNNTFRTHLLATITDKCH